MFNNILSVQEMCENLSYELEVKQYIIVILFS